MELVQLPLWLDNEGRAEVQCTHCGWKFDALPQIRARSETVGALLLEHPKVRVLPQASQRFLGEVLDVLLGGERVGITELARETSYTVPGAQWQVKRLVKLGVLEAVPKRVGGTYHLYKLAITPNGQNPIKTP